MRKMLWFLSCNRGFADGDPPPVVKINNPPPTDPPVTHVYPEVDMVTAIPPEHRNKEYFKDITFEKMTNEFVALQAKLGERPSVGVPGADATSEQVTNFYNSLRPKEMSEYAFPETEFSKTHGRNENFQTGMREVFHKAGVSQHQVQLLTEGYDALASKIKADGAEADQKFDDKITEIYGKDGREAALNISKNLMKESIPDNLKPLLEGIPNNALLLLTTTLNAVHNKYIKEDHIPPGGVPPVGDQVALRAEGMKLMQSAAYKDFRDPGHDAVQAKVKEIYGQIAAIQKATTQIK